MNNDNPEPNGTSETKILEIKHIGKRPRARVAEIAEAALDSRTSLDETSVRATIDALQAVLPEVVNVVIGEFKRNPEDPLEAQSCPSIHSCVGEFEPGERKFARSSCAVETCSIQACGLHTCGANACSTESCVGQTCESHAPAPDDDALKSHTFQAVKEHLERLAIDPEAVQPFVLNLRLGKTE